MFGLLQLSYFSLSNYDFVPSSLTGLLKRKQINGLNVRKLMSSNSIPSRVSTNGYSSSQFLSNFNIMFLITLIIALVGLVLYTVTYIINKNQYEKARRKRIKSPHSEVNIHLHRVDFANSKSKSNNHDQSTGIASQSTS